MTLTERVIKNDLMSQTFVIDCISIFSCRYHFGLLSQTYGSLAQLCQGNQSNISIIVTKIKIKVTTNIIFICYMINSYIIIISWTLIKYLFTMLGEKLRTLITLEQYQIA